MIVVDASAMAEVLSVLRGLLLGRKLRPVAEAARADHSDLAILRHDTAPFAEEIWSLRHQYTSYDAAVPAYRLPRP